MEFYFSYKVYLINGAYYFSKLYIVYYRNKTRKHKVNRFISLQNNGKVKKYSIILSDLVILELELISLNG